MLPFQKFEKKYCRLGNSRQRALKKYNKAKLLSAFGLPPTTNATNDNDVDIIDLTEEETTFFRIMTDDVFGSKLYFEICIESDENVKEKFLEKLQNLLNQLDNLSDEDVNKLLQNQLERLFIHLIFEIKVIVNFQIPDGIILRGDVSQTLWNLNNKIPKISGPGINKNKNDRYITINVIELPETVYNPPFSNPPTVEDLSVNGEVTQRKIYEVRQIIDFDTIEEDFDQKMMVHIGRLKDKIYKETKRMRVSFMGTMVFTTNFIDRRGHLLNVNINNANNLNDYNRISTTTSSIESRNINAPPMLGTEGGVAVRNFNISLRENLRFKDNTLINGHEN